MRLFRPGNNGDDRDVEVRVKDRDKYARLIRGATKRKQPVRVVRIIRAPKR